MKSFATSICPIKKTSLALNMRHWVAALRGGPSPNRSQNGLFPVS